MPQARKITLTAAEEATLVEARDNHPVPYARERAAAMLKVAAGWSVRQVAAVGLLRPRCPETVGDWIDRYQEFGVVALGIRPGRGRKPAYARAGLAAKEAAAAVLDQVHRSPRVAAGIDRSRWTLATLLTTVLWLRSLGVSGLSRLLSRLKIRYRRGQEHFHSPDPEYDAKLAAVTAARAEAVARPGVVVFVYQDEFTAYRRPSVAQIWHQQGGPGRPAELGQKSNYERRLIGTLDVADGRVFCWQRAHANVATLIRFYVALSEAYPAAERIYVAQDNWPVHFHQRLLEALEGTKVKLLRLPTYAPWTNPIEKLWRRLKQEVLHQHDFADDWDGLKATITAWLDKWAGGSPDLLRYVGLCPD
jgi:transposase